MFVDRDLFNVGIMELESGRVGEGTLNLLSSPNFRHLIGVALDWDLQPESLRILRRIECEWRSAPNAPASNGDPVGASLALFRCGKRFLEGNAGQALAEAGRAWICHPTYRAAVVCAHLLAHLDLPDEALRMWEQALSLPDAEASGWCERGEFRLRLGDTQGALTDLNRALEMAPDSHLLYSVRAHIHKRLGLYGLARRDEFEAIRIRSGAPPLPPRESPRSLKPPGFSAADGVWLLTFLLACLGMARVTWLFLRELINV